MPTTDARHAATADARHAATADARHAATTDARHVHIAIIGAGFSGLGMAIRLRQRGCDDFAIFERAHDVGGVWRDNVYPGCACDVPSHLYTFSFAPNPEWSRVYSTQPELQRYLADCARRFGLMPFIRFDHTLRGCAWDATAQRWRLDTSQGPFSADLLVAAAGALSEPSLPSLPGLDRFAGAQFHSARWDRSYDLTGKRVAVIGTGASAIQIVPAIQPKVAQLTLFQRTPPWIIPRADLAFSEEHKARLRRSRLWRAWARGSLYAQRELWALPFLHPWLSELAERLPRRHLQRQVADPVLRARLTPRYRLGCKRVLVSDDYYPAVSRTNVELVTSAIAEVRSDAIVSADGVRHPVDAIIFGTGFHTTDMPIAELVRGRDGRSLAEVWQGSPRAHLGTTVHGFPNLFLVPGPNTGLGHTSVLLMIESQLEHVLQAIDLLQARGAAAIEPRAAAQAKFVAEIDRKMRNTVWTQGGCTSWYLDGTGRNSTLWPGFTFSFRLRLTRFRASEYTLEARHARPKDLAGTWRVKTEGATKAESGRTS